MVQYYSLEITVDVAGRQRATTAAAAEERWRMRDEDVVGHGARGGLMTSNLPHKRAWRRVAQQCCKRASETNTPPH